MYVCRQFGAASQQPGRVETESVRRQWPQPRSKVRIVVAGVSVVFFCCFVVTDWWRQLSPFIMLYCVRCKVRIDKAGVSVVSLLCRCGLKYDRDSSYFLDYKTWNCCPIFL